PALFEIAEATEAVMSFQGFVVAVAHAVVQEAGELLGPVLLGKELHEGHALRVERANIIGIPWIILQLHQIAQPKEPIVLATMLQISEMALDLIAGFC